MAGYNPASTLISNLPQAQATYFDKDFIANLKANTPFLRCTERRELPAQSGNQHRLYMYQAFAGNTSQSAEGTVQSGITPSVNTSSAVIGQYADYVNVSDIALETAIDPALENLEREVAFRLALTVNALVRNTSDAANAIDASVSSGAKAANTPITRTDLTAAVQSLRGKSVLPFDAAANRYVGVIHPFAVGDIVNDTANNSIVDIYKHTTEGLDRLEELPGGVSGDVIQVLDFGGYRMYESNTVTSTANYASSGKTGLRTYLYGNQAVIAISLGVKENAQIGQGDWHNMKIWMNRYDSPSPSDAARMIGGSVAYNVKFVSTLPPDTVMRLRYVDANTNIS